MRILLAGTALLLVAACSQEAPVNEAPSTRPPPIAEPVPTPVPASPAAANVLTANGFGPLRIGMTRAEVEAALGADANPNAVGGADPASCDQFRPARAPDGMLVMINDGVLTNVSLVRASTVQTDRGVKIGDPASKVTGAYGSAAEAIPHKYESAPAQYIFVWSGADHTSRAARGIKYEIGQDGNVKSIAGGGPTIAYVEGCA